MSLGHPIHDADRLSTKDYEVIGKFTQTYCIADFEARRMINYLTHIQLGEPKSFALKLNDKDVLDHLMACANSCTWNLDLAAGIRKSAEIFRLHRQLRHIFAHWAGRKISGHDSFIFFTANLAKQKLLEEAIKIEEEEGADIRYAVIPISHLLKEQMKLEGHVQYLENMTVQLESKASQIAKQFAKDVADGKILLKPYRVVGSGRA